MRNIGFTKAHANYWRCSYGKNTYLISDRIKQHIEKEIDANLANFATLSSRKIHKWIHDLSMSELTTIPAVESGAAQ